MTEKDGVILAEIAAKVGLDPYKINPTENPFSKSGTVARQLQMGVSELYPEVAARWRSEIGSISAGTIAELQSGQPLSQRAQQDLWDHDPQFVRDFQKQQADSDAALLASLDASSDELRLKRETRQAGGNERVARDRIKAQDEKQQAEFEARRAAEAHSQQLNQRMAERRAEADRMAGRFVRP